MRPAKVAGLLYNSPFSMEQSYYIIKKSYSIGWFAGLQCLYKLVNSTFLFYWHGKAYQNYSLNITIRVSMYKFYDEMLLV